MSVRATLCFVAILVAACAPGSDRADTTAAAPAVDTILPPPGLDSVASKARDSASATKTSSPQPSRGTVRTSRKNPHDSIIGRDSVIEVDPSDPRRQLPTVKPDTGRPPR
jgi:hypothetical protein